MWRQGGGGGWVVCFFAPTRFSTRKDIFTLAFLNNKEQENLFFYARVSLTTEYNPGRTVLVTTPDALTGDRRVATLRDKRRLQPHVLRDKEPGRTGRLLPSRQGPNGKRLSADTLQLTVLITPVGKPFAVSLGLLRLELIKGEQADESWMAAGDGRPADQSGHHKNMLF